MASMQGWLEFCKRMEINQRDGKYYVGNLPSAYESEEEAKMVSERLKNVTMF